MYLMIDNYDSFVYNLKAYFEELGREILVKRSDEITLDEIEDLKPEGIILSPGPKRPRDAALCVETVRRFQKRIPILGVCLGHQVLGYCSGATVEKGETAYAWKGDGGASQRYGAVCRPSGEISCDPVSFSDREAGYASRRL